MGLDITSVLLNPFKMAATYPFCDFFLLKNHTNGWFPRDTLWIEKVLSIPTNFPFVLNWKLARIWSVRFLYRRYTYEVVPIYWLALTLDPCPHKKTNYSSSIMDYFHYNPTRVLVEQNKRCRAKSIFIPISNGGCKNPQRIVSFKSHVAFYHIVSNEVLP